LKELIIEKYNGIDKHKDVFTRNLAQKWEAPSKTPSPKTQTKEPWETEQPSLLRWLLDSEDLTEDLNVTAVLNSDDLLGTRSVEDDIDQADEALGLLHAKTDLSGVGGSVQVQLDWLALNNNGVVHVGLVLEATRVELEHSALNWGHRRFDWVASQAEHFELAWDLTEWPFNDRWTLDDARNTTAS